MQATGRQSVAQPRFLLAALKTPWGRVLLIAMCYVGFLPGFGSMALAFTAGIALTTVWPRHRRSILSAMAIVVCLLSNGPQWFSGTADPAINRLALRGLLAGSLWIAALLVWTRLLPTLPRWVERHSLLLLHGAAVLWIAGLWAIGERGAMSGVTAAAICSLVPELVWRSSYWMKWRARQGPRAPIWNNLFAALPFVGSGGVPFGKGPAYLARHEVTGEDQLAAGQLEGAKLLLLSFAYRVLDAMMGAWLCGLRAEWSPRWAIAADPILPSMEALLRGPELFSLWQRWAGLYLELCHNILALALYGHLIVAVFCLAGFRIPRNTQAPLLATTVQDFWSRYYFYFKELLMDFFFFPAFLRAPGAPLLLRTLAATFAAAFFGNVYYHLLMYSQRLVAADPGTFISLASARAVYCAFLAAALCVSFARALEKRTRPAGLARRLLQMLAVSTVFALIHVWNYAGDVTLQQRLDLWRSLVGWI